MPTIQTNCLWRTLLCLLLTASALAQTPPADTSHSLPGARAAIFYQSYIGADAAIYNGYAYQPHYQGVQGSPHFLTDNITDGSLTYEGLNYIHIPLLYNLVLDQLIISDPKGQLLILSPDKVQQFSLADHHFVHLSTTNTPGYYELLRSGYISLFVRHTKKIVEKIESAELHRYISSRDDYYLYKQDHYYPVESGRSLLTLLADKKQQLQQYQRSEHIRFKKDAEGAMEKITDYYNQLPH
jgi:hypothetical protein